MDQPDLITTLLIVLLGCGIFLRVVAREKNRRERWLQYRLEQKIEEIKKQKEVTTLEPMPQTD